MTTFREQYASEFIVHLTFNVHGPYIVVEVWTTPACTTVRTPKTASSSSRQIQAGVRERTEI